MITLSISINSMLSADTFENVSFLLLNYSKREEREAAGSYECQDHSNPDSLECLE
jgi:hypothetical protein